MGTNRINNVFTNSNIGNINFFGATISSTSGDLIFKIDTDDIQLNNGTTTTMNVSTNGVQTLPLQPCFLAYRSTNSNNVTGNNTEITVNFDVSVKDSNNNFTSGTTFTCPVAGKYLFITNVTFTETSVAMTTGTVKISTSNWVYHNVNNAQAMSSVNDNGSLFLSVITYMDAADTAQVLFTISGGAGNSADIVGSSVLQTYFCGALIA
jgi:hypothetical protein